MNHGIDISFWQGNIDFSKVRTDFIIVKEGYGQSVDDKFFEYVDKIKDAGIQIPGVYHFIYAISKEEAVLNAKSCIKNVERAGLPKSTVIWADLEYDTVKKAQERGVKLSPGKQKYITIAFCREIQKQGYPVGIYCNPDYLKNVYKPSIANKYDIWLSDWNKTTPAYPCVYWQDTDKHQVNGINGGVDSDWYFGMYTAGTAKSNRTIDELAKDVIAGKFGTGNLRRQLLGDLYKEVQARVNEMLAEQEKTIDELAQEVLAGKYGTGEERKKALGDKYEAVQAKVNALLSFTSTPDFTSVPDFTSGDSDTMSKREQFVKVMQSWVGKSEHDGTFKSIIDTYNKGLQEAVNQWGTRNVRMQYDWAWCACTVSAAAMQAGCADIVPIEISCPYMIEIAQRNGLWVESDNYTPQPGDIILYDWEDSNIGDNKGVADHVGVVEQVNGIIFTVIEGNKNDGVEKRTMHVNGQYIRGFIVPKF